MKRRIASFAVVFAAVVAVACNDDTSPVNNTVTFTASMSAANEPTPITSNGVGTFTGVLDTVTNVFTYDVTFSGMTSNVNLGHIHGPAGPTETKPPILDFKSTPGGTFEIGGTSGTAHGVVTLTAATAFAQNINGDSLRKLLFNGKTYANIHTVNNGAGEIRGQILLKTP